MSRARFWLNLLLTGLLTISALLVVNLQYHARQLFIALETAQNHTQQLEMQWSQLQLDHSKWGQSSRVVNHAKNVLNMTLLSSKRTHYLKLGNQVSIDAKTTPQSTKPPVPVRMP